MISSTLTSHDVSEYLYHMNFVLRNVLMSRTVGQVKSEFDLSKSIDHFRFRRVFDFSSSQLLTVETPSLQKIPDSVVGFDVMRGCENIVKNVIRLIRKARVGSIVLISTVENHINKPECFYSNQDWREILGQAGSVILVKSLDAGSIFSIVR